MQTSNFGRKPAAFKPKLKGVLKGLLALLILALGGMASPAAAWWQKDWAYRKAVTIDTTASGVNVSGPIGRTLVLIRLHSGNFTFTDALDNGADIRFVDSDDKSPLTYHVESYDAKNGVATVWVSMPALNGGEKKQIWLYFGNKTAPVGEDVKGSFDPDYTLAYHFSEGPGQPTEDKTANGNTAANAPAGVEDSAIIGHGGHFVGQGGVTVNDNPSLAMTAGAPFTFTAWVKPDNLAGDQQLFSRGGMVIGISGGLPYVTVGSGRAQATAPVKQGDWTHVGVVADGTTLKIYVNGVEAGAVSVALPAIAGPITIGGTLIGSLDEVRLSKTARPPAMLMAMASAEGPATKLVGVSETAEKQGGGGGVLFFIVSKLEPLDAGIIGLCMILLTMAITLMVQKIRYLNAADKANVLFYKRFDAMHEELVPLADAEGISAAEADYIKKASPIARLYEMGISELAVRRKVSVTRPLSGEAVEAMRAAVDAVYVNENQKLDSLMVILTIAISGGPFIGLLGTVIGVMTVFGGVAMAGDVNVNAIAPGIAAALLATIAGLACAIPALFGYNYLNGRITVLADQMRVFIDRLITRLAEMQADAAYAREAAE
jgi:biopolymer transport protein ExbB